MEMDPNVASRRVEFVEADSIKAANFLIARGYQIASTIGIEQKNIEKDSGFGVLKPLQSDSPKRSFLKRILPQPTQRRELIGTIWVSNLARSATSNHWIFEVNGRENFESIAPLVEEMADSFSVGIEARLISEGVKYETLSRDYDI